MTFEYLVVQRTTGHTSGHEQEDMQALLNLHGRDGWRLQQVVFYNERTMMIIFERGRG